MFSIPYEKKEELVQLVKGQIGTQDPTRTTIDRVVSENILHLFNPNDVLGVAYDFGMLISACATDGQRYKANGQWITPTPDLAQKLGNGNYKNLSDTYCDKCAKEVQQQIDAMKQEELSR